MYNRDEIKIGLNTYNVNLCDYLNEVQRDFDAWGICDTVRKEIKLFSGRTRADITTTFIHEVCHAVLIEYGIEGYFNQTSTDIEAFVTTFAALYAHVLGTEECPATSYGKLESLYTRHEFKKYIIEGCQERISGIFLGGLWDSLVKNKLVALT